MSLLEASKKRPVFSGIPFDHITDTLKSRLPEIRIKSANNIPVRKTPLYIQKRLLTPPFSLTPKLEVILGEELERLRKNKGCKEEIEYVEEDLRTPQREFRNYGMIILAKSKFPPVHLFHKEENNPFQDHRFSEFQKLKDVSKMIKDLPLEAILLNARAIPKYKTSKEIPKGENPYQPTESYSSPYATSLVHLIKSDSGELDLITVSFISSTC